MAKNQRCFSNSAAQKGGSKGQSQCGDHRFTKRENGVKRGAQGYDAGKKIKGRKRHIAVDTNGLLLAVAVHSAEIQDTNGAYFVLRKMMNKFSRLSLIWVDGGYKKSIIDWAKDIFGWTMQVVKRSDDVKGFKLLPWRWVVERTFSWIGNSRRTAKDYEHSTHSSEAMVYIPMIRIMLKRLTKT